MAQTEWLSGRGAVASGPKKSGGLVAKKRRDQTPSEDVAQPILSEAWEVEVVTHLMYLFQHAELEKRDRGNWASGNGNRPHAVDLVEALERAG